MRVFTIYIHWRVSSLYRRVQQTSGQDVLRTSQAGINNWQAEIRQKRGQAKLLVVLNRTSRVQLRLQGVFV